MMLVISVIVAIAILGILLGFLGNVTIIGADAKQVIADNVKEIYNKGYGVTVSDRVDFKQDTVLTGKDITNDLFSSEQIKLHCAGEDSICGDGEENSIEINDDPVSIIVNKGAKAYVAVCTEEGVDYHVVIGTKSTEVRNECLELIG